MTTKYKNILFSGLLASVILVTASCNLSEQESYTGTSTLSASSPTVTINADDFINIPGVEKDQTYTYTVTLSEPQIADVKIQVFQSGGTATEGEDFTLDHTVTIPAYETTGSGTISTIADTDPEDSETLQITIGDETTANVIYTPQVYDFVIDNFVSEVLDISFAFCEEVTFDGDLYVWPDLGGDPDIFVSDAAGFDINDPWATFNGTDYAASGDCPEVLTMDKADWGDGEYVLWYEIWSNVNYAFWEPQLIPIVATFTQAGLFQKTVIQDPSQAIDVTLPGVDDADYAGTDIWGAIAIVEIVGDLYIIKDYEGNEIVSGKIVDGKMTTARPAELGKASSSALRLKK